MQEAISHKDLQLQVTYNWHGWTTGSPEDRQLIIVSEPSGDIFGGVHTFGPHDGLLLKSCKELHRFQFQDLGDKCNGII